MAEKDIREGIICQSNYQYAKTNEKYMKDFIKI